MKVEFLEAAQTELDQAFECCETQQKELGVQFLNEFPSFPRSGVGMQRGRSCVPFVCYKCLI